MNQRGVLYVVMVYCLPVSLTEFHMQRVNSTGFGSYVDCFAPSPVFLCCFVWDIVTEF